MERVAWKKRRGTAMKRTEEANVSSFKQEGEIGGQKGKREKREKQLLHSLVD